MAALIHHGGSGITAYGLRAGVPAGVVPFLFDQFYWGRRVAELGVGLALVPFGALSAGRLADAIRAATIESGMRERARRLGTEIREEDGLNRPCGCWRGWRRVDGCAGFAYNPCQIVEPRSEVRVSESRSVPAYFRERGQPDPR